MTSTPMTTPPVRPATRAPLATLEAVAASAGVSRSTVSRVVNGSSQVSPEVLVAVQEAISRLNYVPNRAARSLANNQTMAIALVIPEDTTRFFGDPYFASIVKGIAHALEDSDYVLNLHVPQAGHSDKTIRYLTGGNVDGAIVVSHHQRDQYLIDLAERMPVVFGGRPMREDDSFTHFVDVDNTAAAAAGTAFLIERGYQRIGMVAGPADMPAGEDRRNGWSRTLMAAGLSDERLTFGDFSLPSGSLAMREMLDSHPDLDAVFVASDLMALGAISVIRDRGLRIPGDIAVLGFDDSPMATAGDIQLTTVRQPSEEMGALMAGMMVSLLRGDPIENHVLMPTTIIERDSA